VEPFKLPDTFLLGTATASLQIEGGDRNNSWFRWCEQGHVKEGHCAVACDHWNRVEEDTTLMKSLNHHTYRLSIEWSRIEPEKGRFDPTAMAHYRREIEGLTEAGIVPLVTLHHFSNPLWLEDAGAWINPEVVGIFERYTAYVVEALGDLVADWVTINEPNVYAAFGYLLGNWPPGKTNLSDCLKVARNMALAHINSYRKIHEMRAGMGKTDTMVGVANHLRLFESKNGYLHEKWLAALVSHLFEGMFVTAMAEGRLTLPLGSGYPLGKGRYVDFMGINYYSREMISFTSDPGMLFAKMETRAGAPVNDLGWEIYPEGLYLFCRKYWDRYGVPIYITENGTCDNRDAFRARYIYDHLYQVKRLIDEGVDVRRYYHWTFTDNFEWEAGMAAKFGIVELNYETQERKVRPSGLFFADVCRDRGVTEEMIARYLQ
jgi:beta-glucosidase